MTKGKKKQLKAPENGQEVQSKPAVREMTEDEVDNPKKQEVCRKLTPGHFAPITIFNIFT